MHYKKRNTYLILLIILITIFLTACQSSEDKDDEKVHFDPYIISTEADAEEELLDAAVYEGMAYLISQSKIITYDLTSGERTVLVEATGNTAIYVDKNYIYTYNKEQNAVIKYNLKGEIKKTYPFSFEPIDANFIRVSKDMAVIEANFINNKGDAESELYKLNMSDGLTSRIPNDFKGKDDYSLILSLDFIDKNTIMIASAASTSIVNPIMKGYKYDIQKEKLMEEFILPNNGTYSYNPQKNCINYYKMIGFGDGSYNYNIREHYLETGIDITTKMIDFDRISSLSNIKDDFHINKMFCSESTIIFWSNYNDCFLVIDQSEEEHLNVLISKNSLMIYSIPQMISRFEAEYGYPVHIVEYPEDIYKDKLRIKLLSGDSDYDVFFINNPNENNLLSSILKYDLFEPLDNYEGLTNNFSQMFDGISSMMSYNNRIFGIPFVLNYYNSYDLKYDLTKYGYTVADKQLTNDDIWNLCEEVIKSGEQEVSIFERVKLVDFVISFVQESIDKNYLDKNALTYILENIKKYSDAGVLFDNGNSSEGKRCLLDFSINYFYMALYSEIPIYPEFGTVQLATNNKKNLWNLNVCAFINKYSKNKEMAANLLKVMTNSEYIYNTEIYQFIMLGSDLTRYDKYNEWSSDRLSYLSDLSYIFKNSAIITYDVGILTELIYETITSGLLDGSISPQQAADMIYEQVQYTYFE